MTPEQLEKGYVLKGEVNLLAQKIAKWESGDNDPKGPTTALGLDLLSEDAYKAVCEFVLSDLRSELAKAQQAFADL